MLISFKDFMNFADGDLQSSLNNSSGHAANTQPQSTHGSVYIHANLLILIHTYMNQRRQSTDAQQKDSEFA